MKFVDGLANVARNARGTATELVVPALVDPPATWCWSASVRRTPAAASLTPSWPSARTVAAADRYPFELRIVEAPAPDDDGEPVTTMVVNWSAEGGPAGGVSSRKRFRGLRLAARTSVRLYSGSSGCSWASWPIGASSCQFRRTARRYV